ncbi:MAG: hypothetical protein PHI55_12115 [Burkholderiaceae bacterium]|nr:hypothetical protein [Burkholderiaceae bacterium]
MAVSSVGNHEVDSGKAQLLRLTQGGCFKGGAAGVDPCLSHGQFEGAKFQYLAANVIDNSTGKLLPPGDTIHTLNAVKVGFIGLTLAWPATTSSTTAVST